MFEECLSQLSDFTLDHFKWLKNDSKLPISEDHRHRKQYEKVVKSYKPRPNSIVQSMAVFKSTFLVREQIHKIHKCTVPHNSGMVFKDLKTIPAYYTKNNGDENFEGLSLCRSIYVLPRVFKIVSVYLHTLILCLLSFSSTFSQKEQLNEIFFWLQNPPIYSNSL